MRPIKLALENFGPYRERAEVDFSRLGEFFLICGKTGSGKSTLFDAITYALFGQAPGARKGSESEFVSDFAKPGDKPLVEFEFALSGTRYKVLRVAPFLRPKRGGGFVDVPPTAALFTASVHLVEPAHFTESAEAEGGWRVAADGVRDTNEKVSRLIGLTAEEFSKIILLPQGDFQKFLEMESTERSLVLEKLFPVGLHERMTEIAKAKTQEAKVGLSLLEAEIGRLAAEVGDEPEARLAALKGELEEALGLEAGASGEAAARELVLERERERAARAARAIEAAKALAQLEEKGPVESTRAARIASAKAAASVAPYSLAFSKARAAAVDLSERAARHAAELSELGAAEPRIEAARSRIAECSSLIADRQKEVFGLRKAVEVWKRRADALVLSAEAEARSVELDGRWAREVEDIERLRRELDAARPKPEEEAAMRAELEKLQAAASGLALLVEQAKRRAGLSLDLASAEKSKRGYEAALAAGIAARDETAGALAGLEAALAHSEAVRLAGSLEPGEPCPVCGSREHPLPASPAAESGSISLTDVEAARARHMKASGETAGLTASLSHAAERVEEIASALSALSGEIGERAAVLGQALSTARVLPSGIEPAAIPAAVAGFDEAAAAAFASGLSRFSRENAAAIAKQKALASRFEARRREVLTGEEALAARKLGAEALRAQAEKARAELVERRTVLAEAERESGIEDPEPALGAAVRSLEALEAEKTGLEAECSRWNEGMATAKAKFGTLERERDVSFVSLAAEFARLADSLSLAGFLPAAGGALWAEPLPVPAPESLLGEDRGGLAAALAEAKALELSAAALAAEELASSSYREALSAARAKAFSLEADMPAPGSELPDVTALEAAVGEARAALTVARSRSDASRRSIDRLEESLSRRADFEARRSELEEGSRTLNRLSELLRGDVSGRHLPFKNFVLAMYFREVTRRASAHLSRMSDGRYYLKPDEGQASGRGKIGLGLRVLDAWTGQDRPTATLSGGEKFLTSISLALGLADSIREQNGGVSLDAVFIDEGFGSLDDEALDRVITVLDKIRGSRVIGIVSHVAGLKARIPARIEVEKTASGSRLSQSAIFSDQAL